MRIVSVTCRVGVGMTAEKTLSVERHKAEFTETPNGVLIKRKGKPTLLVPWAGIEWAIVEG